jgi:hypothetical protein
MTLRTSSRGLHAAPLDRKPLVVKCYTQYRISKCDLLDLAATDITLDVSSSD